MEIHSLRVSFSEQDLNDLAGKHLADDQPIEGLTFHITTGGMVIKGTYPLFVNVSFETSWEVGVHEDKLTARLTGFRAMGIPGNIFKSAILKLVGDSARDHDWLSVDHDTIRVDVDRLLLENGLTARTNLTAVSCQNGLVVIEAARSA
jgi:hypothetical protein